MDFEQLEKQLFANRPLPRTGSLLLANPFLRDPNFRKTVVLLVEHNHEGALGFVLNRRMDLDVIRATEGAVPVGEPVYYGGPVQMDTLFYVHRLGDDWEGSHHVMGAVTWGGSLAGLTEARQYHPLSEDNIRFFAGYSGWSRGQLEAEWEEKAWLVFPAREADIFDTDAEQLYQQLLLKLGVPGAFFRNVPKDPHLN
jgi:putative transcriptional regulator